MKIYKVLILTTLFAVGFSIPGCEDPCNCPPVAPFKKFDYVEVVFRQNGQLLEAGDTVSWSNLEIGLQFELAFHSEVLPIKPGRPGFSLIPSALACSCLWEGYEGLSEKVDALEWITQEPFDSTHLQSSLLTEYIVHEDASDLTEAFNTFVNEDVYSDMGEFPVKLMQGPTDTIPFQLLAQITMDGGDLFTGLSPIITLTP